MIANCSLVLCCKISSIETDSADLAGAVVVVAVVTVAQIIPLVPPHKCHTRPTANKASTNVSASGSEATPSRSPMQAHRLRQVQTGNKIKHARSNDIRVSAADVENVERLPVAVKPGADVEQPRRCVFAFVYIAFLGPGSMREAPSSGAD